MTGKEGVLEIFRVSRSDVVKAPSHHLFPYCNKKARSGKQNYCTYETALDRDTEVGASTSRMRQHRNVVKRSTMFLET